MTTRGPGVAGASAPDGSSPVPAVTRARSVIAPPGPQASAAFSTRLSRTCTSCSRGSDTRGRFAPASTASVTSRSAPCGATSAVTSSMATRTSPGSGGESAFGTLGRANASRSRRMPWMRSVSRRRRARKSCSSSRVRPPAVSSSSRPSMAAIGLPTSWASPAARRPTEASRSDRTRRSWACSSLRVASLTSTTLRRRASSLDRSRSVISRRLCASSTSSRGPRVGTSKRRAPVATRSAALARASTGRTMSRVSAKYAATSRARAITAK